MAAPRRDPQLRRDRADRARRRFGRGSRDPADRRRTARRQRSEPPRRGDCSIPGIDDIALSTNGLLLEEQLPDLVTAGLRRINLSLDTLRPGPF